MRPLEGIKVLDMSRVLAGPFAGRILHDLGAEVVKIEPPEGDVTRNWGKVRAGLAGYYTQQNVGKRNVCIDLRAEGGAEKNRVFSLIMGFGTKRWSHKKSLLSGGGAPETPIR